MSHQHYWGPVSVVDNGDYFELTARCGCGVWYRNLATYANARAEAVHSEQEGAERILMRALMAYNAESVRLEDKARGNRLHGANGLVVPPEQIEP